MADIADVVYAFMVEVDNHADYLFDAYRLHMLCVYSQAIILGYKGKPLFEDDIRMYDFGPSVPFLVEKYPLGKKLPKIEATHDSLMRRRTILTKLELRVVTLVEITYGFLANWYIRERVKLDFKEFLSSRDVISKDDLKAKFHKFLLPLSENTINLWDLGVS